MNKLERTCLGDFFKSISEYDYVVLRNADGLPEENTSNDIDIGIDPKQYQRFRRNLLEVMARHGFWRMEYSRFHGIACHTFYNVSNAGEVSSLKIDLFRHFEGGGVKYLDFSYIYQYHELNENGVKKLTHWGEALLTAAKVFASGGDLPPKYQKPFLDGGCPDEYLAFIGRINSPCLRKKLLSLISGGTCDFKGISRKKIVSGVMMRNFISNPFATFGRLAAHVFWELQRFFSNRHLICFVGPDGSGKSTVINEVIAGSREHFRSPSSRFVIFHHRPHLLCNLGGLFRRRQLTDEEIKDETFNPHGGKTSGSLVSLIKLCWYCLDYRLGYLIKIFPLFRRGKVVFFDRYFFDFFADQQRSAMRLPKWIVCCCYWLFIPKPDSVFFIKVAPEVALSRKQEISMESIAGIIASYEQLAQKYPAFSIVENNVLEDAVRKVTADLVFAITVPVF